MFSSGYIYATNNTLPISAALNSANSLLLLQDSPSNQKICPAIISNSVETSYLELYSDKDLCFYSLDIGKQFKFMNFGLGISSLNHPIYKENTANFAISKKILMIHFGTSFSYISTKINSKEEKSSSLSFGIKTEQNNWASQFSINKISLLKSDDKEMEINLENSYKITKNTKISVGLFKENSFDFSFRIGLAQEFSKYLTLISSYQYLPDRFGMGMTFHLQKIYIIYGIRTHQELDLTHALSIGYNF